MSTKRSGLVEALGILCSEQIHIIIATTCDDVTALYKWCSVGADDSSQGNYARYAHTCAVTSVGPHLNTKTIFPRYGDSHVKDKMVARPSYL